MASDTPTVGSKNAYSRAAAIEYLESAAPDDAAVRAHMDSDDIAVKWDGMNRREVFTHLLARGWAVTSISKGGPFVWLERVESADPPRRDDTSDGTYPRGNFAHSFAVVACPHCGGDTVADQRYYDQRCDHADDCGRLYNTENARPTSTTMDDL